MLCRHVKLSKWDASRSAGGKKDVETYSHTLKHFFAEAQARRPF
jgi:hypothetical protein